MENIKEQIMMLLVVWNAVAVLVLFFKLFVDGVKATTKKPEPRNKLPEYQQRPAPPPPAHPNVKCVTSYSDTRKAIDKLQQAADDFRKVWNKDWEEKMNTFGKVMTQAGERMRQSALDFKFPPVKKQETRDPKIQVFITKTRKFRVRCEPKNVPAYEITVGGNRWKNSILRRKYESEIQEKINWLMENLAHEYRSNFGLYPGKNFGKK